jgi:hypothetical protein
LFPFLTKEINEEPKVHECICTANEKTCQISISINIMQYLYMYLIVMHPANGKLEIHNVVIFASIVL